MLRNKDKEYKGLYMFNSGGCFPWYFNSHFADPSDAEQTTHAELARTTEHGKKSKGRKGRHSVGYPGTQTTWYYENAAWTKNVKEGLGEMEEPVHSGSQVTPRNVHFIPG